MSEGPVVLMILSGENAIQMWRDLMGATDPAKAAPGTIRKEFGLSIERNTTHGSDAPETAAFETAYFFSWDGGVQLKRPGVRDPRDFRAPERRR